MTGNQPEYDLPLPRPAVLIAAEPANRQRHDGDDARRHRLLIEHGRQLILLVCPPRRVHRPALLISYRCYQFLQEAMIARIDPGQQGHRHDIATNLRRWQRGDDVLCVFAL